MHTEEDRGPGKGTKFNYNAYGYHTLFATHSIVRMYVTIIDLVFTIDRKWPLEFFNKHSHFGLIFMD